MEEQKSKVINRIRSRVKCIENKFNIIKRAFFDETWDLNTLKKLYRIHTK